MSDKDKRNYLNMLADEISSMYKVSMDTAAQMIKASPMPGFLNKEPAYVDHVPLSSWAEEVWEWNERNLAVTT